MKNLIVLASTLLLACDVYVHQPQPLEPYEEIVYETYVQEEPVVEETVEIIITEYDCSPVLEDYYAPYYHTPDTCTDYGVGIGYCCSWLYIDGYADCSSEWCYWEDVCQWEPVIDTCSRDYYY